MATVLTEHPLSDATRRFLDRAGKLWINGQWKAARLGETFEVYNPATGEIIAHCAAGDKADIDAAVHAARRAFESGPWSKMTPSERGRLIWKLGDLLEEHGDEFAELETLDNGKPLAVARAADVPLAVDLFRYMAGWATKIHGQTFPISVPYLPGSEFFSYTAREPIGVVGQIIPWNFPLLMAAWKLGPALAAGCTVVLKPAEQTPLSALRLGELIEEAGFPEGVVNIVTGLGETAGAALAAHPDVDKIAFTGSTEVGRLIVEAAGKSNLKKVTLELGGKSPNIVLADADLEHRHPRRRQRHLLQPRPVLLCRLAALRAEADLRRSGRRRRPPGPADPPGQRFRCRHADGAAGVAGAIGAGVRLHRRRAFAKGPNSLPAGSARASRGYFVEPTVFAGTQQSMKIVQEEIFGPVVAAMPFDDPDEVLSVANDSTYGLAAAVWTRDVTKAHRLARRLKAGTVWINCYNVFDAALPFGGYKESGWGREMGQAAVELYTEIKAVTTRLA